MGYIFDAMKGNAGKPHRGETTPDATSAGGPLGLTSHTDGDSDTDAASDQADHAGQESAESVAQKESYPSLRFEPYHESEPMSCPSVDDRIVAATESSGVIAEEYRAIRTGLLARWDHKRHLVHTITSATPQEGKTITSLNLGVSMSELRNRRTVVVEADLRLPQFQSQLGLPDSPGVIGLIRDNAKLEDIIQPLGFTPLDVICAGGRANDRAIQMLSSSTMASLIRLLRQRYDHVIIDTPPVVNLADAGIIGTLSDDVILVVRMERTPRPLVEQAIRTLATYNAPVAGVVATDQARHRGKYYSYYRYGYRYAYQSYRKAA